MKRNIIAFFLAINFVFGIYGQSSSQADVILLLDTSSAMSSSFDNVNNYITGAFLSEFLRIGDTFHLITFSGASKLDAARRINSRGDIETIIGRMLLQYPVETGSDTGAAISHAEQYISSLPARPKKVVMISANNASAQVNAAKPRFASKNATLDFVSVVPGQALTNLPSSGRPKPAGSSTPAAPAAAQTSPAAPQASTPATPQTSAPAAPATTQARSTPQTSAPAAAQTSPATPQASTPAAPQTSAPTAAAPATTQARSTPQTSAPAVAQTAPAAPQASTPAAPQTSTPATPQTSAPAAPATPATTQERSAPQASASAAPAAPQASTPAAQTSGSGETPAAKEAKEPVETGSPDHSGKRVSVKTEKPKKESKLNTSVLMIIGIVILALLVLGLVIFFILRRLGSNPSLVMAEASNDKNQDADQGTAKKSAQGAAQKTALKTQQSAAPPAAPFADHSKELASYAAAATKKRSTPYSDRQKKSDNAKPAEINPSGPLLLNLFVEDQNTSIGKRNIHSLKSGYSLSVGGGKSDFLIFLVPMPANIGEIKRNGSECTFIAKKTKYFPDLESGELKNCINKTIRVLSDRNYEMRFRFEMYEDPLIALNRLLHSVKVPG